MAGCPIACAVFLYLLAVIFLFLVNPLLALLIFAFATIILALARMQPKRKKE